MATCKITIARQTLKTGLETYAKTLERKRNAENNPMIQELIEKDLADLNISIASITETK